MVRNALLVLPFLFSVALAQIPSSVGILHRDGKSLCTASVIEGLGVVTAAHCFANDLGNDPQRGYAMLQSEYTLELFAPGTGEGVHYPVQPVKVGHVKKGFDLALLRFLGEEPDVTPLTMALSMVPVGTPLVYYGNPLNLGIQRVTGELTRSSFDDPGSLQGYAVARLQSAQGASGAPVLSLVDGSVVGVLVGFRQGPARNGFGSAGGHFTFLVPLTRVMEFLSKPGVADYITAN